MQSLLPLQVVPFPVKPGLQVQLKEPAVFAQSALRSHSASDAVHSSISVKNKQMG